MQRTTYELTIDMGAQHLHTDCFVSSSRGLAQLAARDKYGNHIRVIDIKVLKTKQDEPAPVMTRRPPRIRREVKVSDRDTTPKPELVQIIQRGARVKMSDLERDLDQRLFKS